MSLARILVAILLSGSAVTQQWQWLPARDMPGDFQGRCAYDEARERVVLFGSPGAGGWATSAPRSYTFEWDGRRWMQRHMEAGNYLDASLCYDPVRRRVVRICGSESSMPVRGTWEWDGQTWTSSDPSLPTARTEQAAAFHVASSRLVMFGGNGPTQNLNLLGDTMLRSASGWSLAYPGSPPTARAAHGMAYDALRQQVVLFGGYAGNLLRNDTWLWNGASWAQVQPSNAPSPRARHALAWDPRRGRIVLFGGEDASGLRDDTWEYDGSNWQLVATAHRPSARIAAGLAWDGGARGLLLFGGRNRYERHTDTWAYDGVDWTRLLDAAGPPRRSGGVFTHDLIRGRTLRFGGYPDDPLTWEGDGHDWTSSQPVPSPVPRYDLYAAFDLWRGRTVMFGGRAASSMFGDTWEWDGMRWSQPVAPWAASPSPRSGGCMAYDLLRGVAVLFGGQDFQRAYQDTWEWNGQTWMQRMTLHIPPPSTNFAMCYDWNLSRIVMFGGSQIGGPTADTWHYDGMDWTLRASTGPGSPPPRYYHTLAWHPQRGKTLLFAGGDAQGHFVDDLWEWDGTQWSRWLLPPPDAQAGATMTYDVVNARMMVTGGAMLSQYADDWLLVPAPPASTAVHGSGCAAGVVPALSCDGAWLGNTGCAIQLADAAPAVPAMLVGAVNSANTPLPGGCSLLLRAPVVTSLGSTNGWGCLRFPAPVPLLPALRGTSLYFQGAVYDGRSPLGGIALTVALRVTAGD